MNCPNCGAELRPEMNFCSKCGQRVRPEASPTDSTAAWQVCYLTEVDRTGMFKVTSWWEARLTTSQGSAVIATSTTYVRPEDDRPPLVGGIIGFFTDDTSAMQERTRSANAQLVAQLAALGWEPAGTDKDGLVTMMKRPMPRPIR